MVCFDSKNAERRGESAESIGGTERRFVFVVSSPSNYELSSGRGGRNKSKERIVWLALASTMNARHISAPLDGRVNEVAIKRKKNEERNARGQRKTNESAERPRREINLLNKDTAAT